MSLVILGILWCVQLVFFKVYYKTMKKAEITNVGNRLVQKYTTTAVNGHNMTVWLKDTAIETAFENSVNIIVFIQNPDPEEGGQVIVAYSDATGGNSLAENVPHLESILNNERSTYFSMLNSVDGGGITYTVMSEQREYIVYANSVALTAQPEYYFCVISSLTAIDATVTVLRDQLVMVTFICIIMSVFLSYLISSRISSPITQFSKTARKLAKGDYNVKFRGNGYTEINELADTLNYATAEMAKTEALRRDFLANVTHDLRTPLTMVKAYAEMIRDFSGMDDKKRNEHAKVIIDEADRLSLLVNDIQDLSKLQSGIKDLTMTEFSISALVREVVERFGIYSERDGYVFETDISGEYNVFCDSKSIEQALYNLISNAVNYTGADKTVKISVDKRENGMIRVSVADSGKGIAPEEIDAVWDRYYRANQSGRKVIGSGLGLSIVKNVLEKNDAPYGVESEIGKGSTFWFELKTSECIFFGKCKASKESRKADKSDKE